MNITQVTDTEIVVYGMVKLSDQEHGLADAQDPPVEPQYWDIDLRVYPDGMEADTMFTVAEYENVTDRVKVAKIKADILQLFPNSSETEV